MQLLMENVVIWESTARAALSFTLPVAGDAGASMKSQFSSSSSHSVLLQASRRNLDHWKDMVQPMTMEPDVEWHFDPCKGALLTPEDDRALPVDLLTLQDMSCAGVLAAREGLFGELTVKLNPAAVCWT